MIRISDKLTHLLATTGVNKKDFLNTLAQRGYGEDDISLLNAAGLPIIGKQKNYLLATAVTAVKDEVFCVVDIETNGSNPDRDQIIEIGAVKICNGEIIGQYESLVHAKRVPEYVSNVTGLKAEDLVNAPSLKSVLMEFKLFLAESVFVAHPLKFDYAFISSMLERFNIPPLMNRGVCTIELAQRTFKAERYGLSHLNEAYELYTDAKHHRALSDAITTAKLLDKCINLLPQEVETTEQLIHFMQTARRLKK